MYKYVNKSTSPVTVGITTVEGYGALVSADLSSDLDPVSNGVQFDKYVDGVLTNLSPFTTPDVTTVKYYTPTTYASLGSAVTAGAGTRAFITDAVQTALAGIGTVVAGGSNKKGPVYSDGTDWIHG